MMGMYRRHWRVEYLMLLFVKIVSRGRRAGRDENEVGNLVIKKHCAGPGLGIGLVIHAASDHCDNCVAYCATTVLLQRLFCVSILMQFLGVVYLHHHHHIRRPMTPLRQPMRSKPLRLLVVVE